MATLLKTLKRKQQKHVEMLARVEKSSAGLDRRKLKLTALEVTLADLERRLSEPRRNGSANGDSNLGLRRALLIFNPASGRNAEDHTERLAQIVGSLRTHGIEAVVGLKTSGKAVRALVNEAVRDECPLVIVAAGDGTIGDVASQLVGTDAVMGLVPIGTMNNVARSLGVPLEIDDACALIGMRTTRHIDVGRVHSGESAHDEFFLECAGIGLSAIGALAGQSFEKRRWRVLPKALQRFFEARLGKMQIEIDGAVLSASTRIVTVSNAPLMGNNMLAAPGAMMDDGQLDISIYDGLGDAALVQHFLAASSHTPDQLKIYRGRKIRITTEEPVLTNSDMSIGPNRNVIEIEVVPGALCMVVGNGIGLTLPVESAPLAPTFAADPPIRRAALEGSLLESNPSRS